MKKLYSLTITALFLIVFAGNVKATDYFLKSGGAAITSTASWANVSNVSPTNFAGANDVWHLTNRTSVNLSTGSFTVPSTATIVVESGMNFQVSGLGNVPNGPSLIVANNGTLTLTKAITYNITDAQTGSTIVYNNTSIPITHKDYHNLVIAQSTFLSGSTFDYNVYGTLTINTSRTLSLSANNIWLKGISGLQITGDGTIYGDGAAGIACEGGIAASNGTLNFASGGTSLAYFSINYNTASDQISLGNDLTITGGGFFQQPSGSLNLNGKKFTIDNSASANFPPGAGTGGIIGSSTSELIIEAGDIGSISGNNELYMDASGNTLRNLVFNCPGLTLLAANTLNIVDSLSVLDGTFDANGKVTINGDATTQGRVSMVGTTGTIAGDLTYRTFISGGNTGWMQMGAPGIDNQFVGDWQDDIPVTCTGCIYAPMGGTFTSIQGWTESTEAYVPLTVASALIPGSGNWVYVGDGASTTNDLTLTNTGAVIQGAYNVALSSSSSGSFKGYNLVANPYASAISWTKVKALNPSNTINNTIQAYSPQLSGYGAFTAGGSGVNMTDIIPAGQAFYVNASAAITLTFNESVKTSNNTTDLMRSSVVGTPDQFKLALQGQWYGDQTLLQFKQGATNSFDWEHDAKKIFSTAGYYGTGNSWSKYTTISTVDKDGKDYIINSLAPLTNSLTVDVRVRVSYPGTYTITAKEMESFGSCLFLKDKLTGIVTDLKSNPYSFTISDTTSAPRFELMFCQTEIGPVGVEEIKAAAAKAVTIGQDIDGAFVHTSLPANTKATISAYNIIGQQVMKDVVITGNESMTRLNLDAHDQVIIIKVTTDKETFTKKIIAH